MLIQRLHPLSSARAKSDVTLRSSICDPTHRHLPSVRALIEGQQAPHTRADTEQKHQDWPHNEMSVHASCLRVEVGKLAEKAERARFPKYLNCSL